ncbi:MAG: pentapeptide repeat-containing protein [Neptuniibacter sp.]
MDRKSTAQKVGLSGANLKNTNLQKAKLNTANLNVDFTG